MREALLTFRLALALLASCASTAPAWAQAASEYEVKAAFVYNFAKFTEWPADAWGRAPTVRICVVGPANEFASALEALGDKPPVQGKAVQVGRVGTAHAELAACHVLVATATDRVPREWLQRVVGSPVLTIGDVPGFAAAGGVVGLVIEAEKVRFEINTEAAQHARLKLSSQVLKLARIVKGSGG